MNQDSSPHSLKTIFLVAMESLLTLVLRFDNKLRRLAYPLATSGTLIAIRSYLPHDEIYLTFTFKGVLFDAQMPKHKQHPDIIINAHSFEFFKAITSDKNKAVDTLQFRGDQEQITTLKDFLYQLSITAIGNNISKNFSHKKSTEQKETVEKKEKVDFQAKYFQIKGQNTQLNIENKRLVVQVTELKSKKKLYNLLMLVTLVFGSVIGSMFTGYIF